MTVQDRLAPVGQKWDFDGKVEVLKEHRRRENDTRRFWIAIAVLGFIGLGVTVLGIYSLVNDDFTAISGFWVAAGPFSGAIIGYYFGKSGDDP